MCSAERWAAFAFLALAAACGDDAGPALEPCRGRLNGSAALNLAVGAYVSLDPTPTGGCVQLAANASATDSVEYLVIPQLATDVPGSSSPFRILGDAMLAPAAAAPHGVAPQPAERFHAFLRRADTRRDWGMTRAMGAWERAKRPRSADRSPPATGSTSDFMVCAALDCSRFDTVTATARAVRSNVAIYVDVAAPASGLDSADLESLAAVFQTRLYPIDTTAFGRESDLDGNGVVVVLMTPTVNALVPAGQCGASGFVSGFFLGMDLDPAFAADPRSNRGEIFYSLVADPTGVHSCAHTREDVRRMAPVTFVHEFQHMISFNQHVLLRGGAGESMWLNEGLAHFAEELAGRSYGTAAPEFSRYVMGDVTNAYQFLAAPGAHFLEAPESGATLGDRGAAWLFVRYVVDRYAGDTTIAAWSAFTRRLLETSLTGAANAAAATGESFQTVATRWALANWVSDLPGFTPPPELAYDSWRFRTTYASLHRQDPGRFPRPFPLMPSASEARTLSLTGTLRAGSGIYHLALQGPKAASVSLLFEREAGNPLDPALLPRLSVFRIR